MASEFDDMEPMELSDEMLESVVGGLNSAQRRMTEKFARDAKRNNLTLEEAIERAMDPNRGSHFNDEMIQYMTEYWDTVTLE